MQRDSLSSNEFIPVKAEQSSSDPEKDNDRALRASVQTLFFRMRTNRFLPPRDGTQVPRSLSSLPSSVVARLRKI